MERLSDAEKKTINENIGVDGQDDTIYEVVEKIISKKIAAERKRIENNYKLLWDFMSIECKHRKDNYIFPKTCIYTRGEYNCAIEKCPIIPTEVRKIIGV